MAGVWSMYGNRRKNGYCYVCYKKIFYLYFFPDPWIPNNLLFIYCLLDEREKLHSKFETKSFKIFIKPVCSL